MCIIRHCACTAEKEDPSQRSSAIRARRKRDSRRPTGKISFIEEVNFFFFVRNYGIAVFYGIIFLSTVTFAFLLLLKLLRNIAT